MDEGTPVTSAYEIPAKFTGTIDQVTIEVQPIGAAYIKAVDESNIEGLAKEGGAD